MIHKIKIARELKNTFLQGRPLGRFHFPILCSLLTKTNINDLVQLDFDGVELVTASWINEAIAPLIEWACGARNDLFPVLINVNSDWFDELSVVSELTHKCFLVGEGKDGELSAILIGKLDVGQRETFDAAISMVEVTGAMLEKSGCNPAVQATAWNNRLRDLYQKRLLKRKKVGREQIYTPVVREVQVYG